MPRLSRRVLTGEYTRIPIMMNKFLRSDECGDADVIVPRFHAWIDRKGLILVDVTPSVVKKFLNRGVSGSTTQHEAVAERRTQLVRYLNWLYAKRRFPFDPNFLLTATKRTLPESVDSFLKIIATTLKQPTCGHYRKSLQSFHNWLSNADYSLRRITRRQIEEWLQCRHGYGNHPATRIKEIHHVRTYLRWLRESGLIIRHPDDLIRRSDFPKLPKYLPRPFPPKADHEIVRRLSERDDIYCKGLLLMRYTGIRRGELTALSFDCRRHDETGRRYLKVPLGKMNCERLVPLDDLASKTIDQLSSLNPKPRLWLLSEPDGSPLKSSRIDKALQEIVDGIPLSERATTHRFRHTYATTLLNAGMSLTSVMKALGHRDYRMTLRYAALSDETMNKEYAEALKILQVKYKNALQNAEVVPNTSSIGVAITDVLKKLQKKAHEASPSGQKRLLLIVRRLDRIRDEILETN